MAEKKTGGKVLSVTRKKTSRIVEKMMQKLGKFDSTKDDVFGDFVNNFTKQHTAALKLQKQLTRYMNALRVLNQSTRSLYDTLEELYEPEWEGYATHKDVFEKQNLLWDDQLNSLQSKMVEPVSHYVQRFPEIKGRIDKRQRKVVDYDGARRELEHVKTKPRVTEQKLRQAEEEYTHAKELYDALTNELYKELPSFYDSRVQFYASVFQSIAATEARFHAEIAKVDEEFAVMMDKLAAYAATGIHSTKKERSIDPTPKLLSRPDDDSEASSEGELQSPKDTSSTTAQQNYENSSDSTPNTTPASTPTRTDSQKKPEKPVPFDSGSLKHPPAKPVHSTEGSTDSAEQDDSESKTEITDEIKVEEEKDDKTPPSPVTTVAEPTEVTPSQVEEAVSPRSKFPPPKPAPLVNNKPSEEEDTTPEGDVSPDNTDTQTSGSVEQDHPHPSTPPIVLYKVVATHQYEGEDEDELSFEKGAIILVVPYDDPDDEDDGWSLGIVEGTNKKGVFPGNFTKRL